MMSKEEFIDSMEKLMDENETHSEISYGRSYKVLV